MTRVGICLAAAALAISGGGASASGLASKFNDPQIAKIAYVGGLVDIEAAQQALGKTQNPEVKAFAQDMVRDHTAVNDQLMALLKKLHIAQRDTDVSRHMLNHATEVRNDLASHDGARFDQGYIQNERNYHLQLDFALEHTFIPQTANPELKELLTTALNLFKTHEQRAQTMLANLRKAAP